MSRFLRQCFWKRCWRHFGDNSNANASVLQKRFRLAPLSQVTETTVRTCRECVLGLPQCDQEGVERERFSGRDWRFRRCAAWYWRTKDVLQEQLELLLASPAKRSALAHSKQRWCRWNPGENTLIFCSNEGGTSDSFKQLHKNEELETKKEGWRASLQKSAFLYMWRTKIWTG